MLHPDVRAIFHNFYYGMEVEYEPIRRWHSSASWHKYNEFPSPFYVVAGGDGLFAIGDETPFFLVQHEQLYRTSKQEIHDRCFHMQKLIDCDRCSWAGDRCVHTFRRPGSIANGYNSKQLRLPFDVENFFCVDDGFVARCIDNHLEKDEWYERKLRTWKTRIAGYIYIPPTAVNDEPLRPDSQAIIHPFNANFTGLEQTKDAFSERSAAAKKTRTFKEQQCTKCYFGGVGYGKSPLPCNPYAPRYCKHGIWDEEEIKNTTLRIAKASLASSALTLEDVWRVARIAGIQFKKPSEVTGRKCEWYVSRILDERVKEGVQIVAMRTALDARGVCKHFSTLNELRAWLPDWLAAELDNVKPLVEEELALWLQVAAARTGKTYSYFFSTDRSCGFAECQPPVGCVRFDNYGSVAVEYRLSRERRISHFSSFKDVVEHFGDLQLFPIRHQTTVENVSTFGKRVR